jgi:hypothetical protein
MLRLFVPGLTRSRSSLMKTVVIAAWIVVLAATSCKRPAEEDARTKESRLGKVAAGTASNGKPCARPEDCRSGVCVFEPSCDPPRGTCKDPDQLNHCKVSTPYCTCSGETHKGCEITEPYRSDGPCQETDAASVAADQPRPAASVELAIPPDVRATISDKGKTLEAKVGQTFGVLLPHVYEPGVAWHVVKKSSAKLGEPLTEISRGGEGVETMWLLAPPTAGKHHLVFEATGRGAKHGSYEVTLVVVP